jgi:hypothetical protein
MANPGFRASLSDACNPGFENAAAGSIIPRDQPSHHRDRPDPDRQVWRSAGPDASRRARGRCDRRRHREK